ncbi:MAG: ABC transporter ATP-binding protein [Myxococcota bacterium]
MSAPAIRLRGVTKRYGERAVVRDLDLDVAPGELVVLLGASGSGKTTLLKTINRLVPPDAGRIELAGEDVSALPSSALRRRIGYVFQKVGLFPHLSVAENVGITPRLLGWEPARVAARVARLLRAMGLPEDVADRFPAALSGGQQQRVGVARALAAEPEVVLFDEPFGALDPVTRDRLQALVEGLRGTFAGVFVTHDVPEALRLGDRIAVLHEGRIVQLGPPEELVRAPAHAQVAALFEAPARQAEAFARLRSGDG